jgi:hypothetical protein
MWSHKKHGKNFKGKYSFKSGERVFELTNGKRTISFESWQMAKSLGWVRQ